MGQRSYVLVILTHSAKLTFEDVGPIYTLPWKWPRPLKDSCGRAGVSSTVASIEVSAPCILLPSQARSLVIFDHNIPESKPDLL